MRAACVLVAAAATAIAGGCAVGPDFERPLPPSIDRYSRDPLPAETVSSSVRGGDVQHFRPGQDVPERWWTLFGSRDLDDLVDQALKQSPTVQSAQAALRQASELLAAQRGGYFPQAQPGYSAAREKNAVQTLSPTLASGEQYFTLHTAQVSVSYLLDVFGGTRRQVEAQQALTDAQRFQLEAAYITLASNVVTAAVTEGSLRAQLTTTQAIVASERQALQILQRQNALGAIAMTDVMAQQALLASSEAGLPALEKQLAQQRHLLAVLAGRFPGDAPDASFELGNLVLPRDLPVSVPARLVRQRPDVLAAEAQVHAASAQVGIAVANLLPQVSLSAQLGGAATRVQNLFSAGSTFWSGGASLTQTLLQGGTLWHRKRAADAALDQAGAQYRAVVLSACQQVADTLRALELDAAGAAAAARAEQAAQESLSAMRRNVELGSVSYLALLNAEQGYQQAVLARVQAQANRFADSAALFQALGGGWWNRPGALKAVDPA